MKLLLNLSFLFSLLTLNLHAEREKVNLSMVISGGVSLGAYESGYNWAMIKMLNKVRKNGKLVKPDLRSVAGASAGSINALLSAMYWCQKDSIPLTENTELLNDVDNNLFYETWVNLGIDDLVIKGEDPDNKSTLFTRKGLEEKAAKIIKHLEKSIYRKNCEVPIGVSVTKATPIVETVQGIKIKNQHFSIPLTLKEKNGQAIVTNKSMPPSTDFYISIPGIEKDKSKLIDVLFASAAFPGAFQQVKLDYTYKGKTRSHYFIDGGAYDNIPLQLAIELDKKTSHFVFIDPSNMRKEVIEENNEEEEIPLGFITTNAIPLLNSLEIFQSMKLYQAINQYIRNDSSKTLILSSRYHPLTGKYLQHFAAFLDKNFRMYDYYVGVYDAIYHLAASFKTKSQYSHLSQIELMNQLKTRLGLDEKPEALAAYTLFLNTEFNHIAPKTTDRYSAIYNSFNTKKLDAKRYDNAEFKAFLSKLDMRYLDQYDHSFLSYAKKDVDHWYKRPLRSVINRITTLENDRAEVYENHESIAKVTTISAWLGSTFIKEKDGFQFLPLNVPQDEERKGLHTALRLLPGEIATDMKNGGASFGYTALYYKDLNIINGFEAKASYIIGSDTPDFVRVDLDAFKEYDDFMKFGLGASFFGDIQGSFYKRESAYGFNTYVDIMDIFRLTYVRRHGDDIENNDYLYFGVENIPSLIYWLNR
ncbi:patatin-like phospholipase family protein [Sulfurovum sp. CS9]|uniref:patatin-like phospholipase family protein n=1 Tax=Sulfurovum sp. CS9 TaxID=3391146 RepID=UPI0039EB72F9